MHSLEVIQALNEAASRGCRYPALSASFDAPARRGHWFDAAEELASPALAYVHEVFDRWAADCDLRALEDGPVRCNYHAFERFPGALSEVSY